MARVEGGQPESTSLAWSPEARDLRDHGQRVADWYCDLALARAEQVDPLGEQAWAARSPSFPRSFATNAVVVRADPGADVLLSWADEVLDGYEHRAITAFCDLTGPTRRRLADAGYDLQELVEMSRPASAGPLPVPEVPVEPADPDTIARLHSVLWREVWLPGIGDPELTDLLGRRQGPPDGQLLGWVVRDAKLQHPVSGDLAAGADLVARDWAGEVDAVATLPAVRGRGYGDALLAAACPVPGNTCPAQGTAWRGAHRVLTFQTCLISPGADPIG